MVLGSFLVQFNQKVPSFRVFFGSGLIRRFKV